MGDVVELHPPPANAAWWAWVRCLCWLAGQPERADDFLSRGFDQGRITLDLRIANQVLRRGNAATTYLDELCGPAGTSRRARRTRCNPPRAVRRRSIPENPA